jgi:outer membrane biogenesis lipoprotein LolB
MVNLARHWPAWLLAAVLLGGCAAWRAEMMAPAADTVRGRQLLLLERAAQWASYQAQAAVRLEGPQGKFRLQAVLVAKPPERLRLEARAISGEVLWALVLDPGRASFWLPADRVLYQAAHGETILAHFLGVPVPPEIFVYGLAGCVPPDHVNGTRFRWADARTPPLWFLRGAENGWQLTWEFLPSPFALKGFQAAQHRLGVAYSIGFEPAVAMDPAASPQKVTIATKRWELEANIRDVRRRNDLPGSVFELPILPGTRVVDLDAQPNAGAEARGGSG